MPERDIRHQTERWLRKQGLPHLIDDYSASDDVLTRMMPLFALLFAGQISLAYGDRFSGWAQAGITTLFAAVLLVAAVGVNLVRKRRPFQLPDSIGWLELGVVVLVPALLSMITATEYPVLGFVSIAVANLIVIGVGYILVSYGVISMLAWSLKFMVRQLAQLMRLIARSLPLLLLFAAFLFLNNEMWQVATDFTAPFYGIILGLFVLASCAFLVVSIIDESKTLGEFSSWDEVLDQVRDTKAPVNNPATIAQASQHDFQKDKIPRKAKFNIGLLLFISQFVRFLLTGVIMGTFFTIFGLLAVRRNTIESWLRSSDPIDPLASWDLFGHEIVLTWELLAVAGFIAVFSALQFVVSSLTDTNYKERFFDDIKDEINEVLAVRKLYLTL